MIKNVAFELVSFNTSRSLGVKIPCGPSSNVRAMFFVCVDDDVDDVSFVYTDGKL